MRNELREELTEKLKTEIEKASWAMLEPHHKRGAIFILNTEESILEAAVAVAIDDRTYVANLIGDAKMKNSKDIDTSMYEADDEIHKKQFDFIIVQPFVFVQKVTQA
jgi:hypothetical protein